MSIDCTNLYISDEQLQKELLVLDNGKVKINEHPVTGTVEEIADCDNPLSLSELFRMSIIEIDGVKKQRTLHV